MFEENQIQAGRGVNVFVCWSGGDLGRRTCKGEGSVIVLCVCGGGRVSLSYRLSRLERKRTCLSLLLALGIPWGGRGCCGVDCVV